MSENKFKKADRLLKRKEFLRVSREGKRICDRHFIIRYLSNNAEKPRLGIIITKKVGNAVIRNRLKRYVRESFRQSRHRMGNPLDLVIIAKQPAADLHSKQAFKLLAELFDQLPGSVDG